MRFEHSFDLFYDSLLPLDFFQELKEYILESMKINLGIELTFSLTAISTAEVGTSSMILSLSSTTFIFTCLLLFAAPARKLKIVIVYIFKRTPLRNNNYLCDF